MMIAKRITGNTFVVGNYQDLFPDASFPLSGPNNQWFSENDCYRINLDIPYDPETQELQPCLPYVENGWAYITRAVTKSI